MASKNVFFCFCANSQETFLLRFLNPNEASEAPFMHSVYDRESERTKISLRGDISLQLRHIPLLHFHDYDPKKLRPDC